MSDDDWYARLTERQCKEIEQKGEKEMKGRDQRLKTVQSKMIEHFRQQQRKLERRSQKTCKQ